MPGTRTTEPAQEPVAADPAGGAVAPAGPAPTRSAAARAETLGRLAHRRGAP